MHGHELQASGCGHPFRRFQNVPVKTVLERNASANALIFRQLRRLDGFLFVDKTKYCH
jgi:hypothetical protein